MAGSWTVLGNVPSIFASTMLLLTDGSVLCHDAGVNEVGTNHWWRLTPNQNGDYIQGGWEQVADGPNSPQFFASAVLRDGRVFVAGGENNGTSATADLLAAEIFDPIGNTWTILPTPADWAHIGDASSCVLPDGRLLLGSIDDNRTAVFDPATNTWTAGGSKLNTSSDEETWTLLPDGTVLTLNCNGHPKGEKYVIAQNQWIPASATPNDLVEASSIEIGPALLLYDGRVFAIGATNHTALYTVPAVPTDPGSWTDGPTFPPQTAGQVLGAKDAPGCLLPNGKVLCVAGPVTGNSADFLPPTYFFEFDPATTSFTLVSSPGNATLAPFNGRMLLLPTGEVLFSNGTGDIEAYTPDGQPKDTWRPRLQTCPGTIQSGQSFLLEGYQLNGLSQAVCYGDDAQMATNYPIVRVSNAASGQVTYCRTSNHSSMGVATGNVLQSTHVLVPVAIAPGASQLVVIANGIASKPIAITVLAS